MKQVVLFLAFAIVTIFACKNRDSSSSNHNKQLQNKIDSLISQNNQLLIKLNNYKAYYFSQNNSIEKGLLSKTYIFVELRVEEVISYKTEFEEHQTEIREILSPIFTIPNFTKEDEYRLLDKAQFDYKELMKNKKEYVLLGRKCYKFNTYEDASKAREKMLNIESDE